MTEPVRRGRRPGAPDTRAAILAAAREHFAAQGFRRTTIRAVASDAGVDPALVHHYFGTKDDLFVAALELPIDPRSVIGPALSGGIDGAAERFAHRVPRGLGRPASCAPACSASSVAPSSPRASA